ncbi:MAG: LuxR family transcriptional regulator [Mesorhizobium sp.]|uniref:helix-turn-helix transcriptional regulator n=1 Tax=Mesorhizobium sp. TaxID=1871066 RepID=UPI000FE8E86B|nr:helix-turn-helix transcriptional regulator [Mesorhizobium sp.]RWL81367.1 MAG: LuxR family transcriptional regulator [Mesorhizobium sp.]
MLQDFPRAAGIEAVGRTIGHVSLANATNVLDRAGCGAIAVELGGSVICANASAARLFGPFLRVSNGRLVLGDRRAAAAYAQRVRDLRAAPRSPGAEGLRIIIRRGEGSPLVMRILPVDGAGRHPLHGAQALMLLVKPIEKPLRPSCRLVQEVLQLTPAEASLASLLATGVTVESAAATLGICKETARNHLKSIFAKTGSHRQAELVALLGSLTESHAF